MSFASSGSAGSSRAPPTVTSSGAGSAARPAEALNPSSNVAIATSTRSDPRIAALPPYRDHYSRSRRSGPHRRGAASAFVDPEVGEEQAGQLGGEVVVRGREGAGAEAVEEDGGLDGAPDHGEAEGGSPLGVVMADLARPGAQQLREAVRAVLEELLAPRLERRVALRLGREGAQQAAPVAVELDERLHRLVQAAREPLPGPAGRVEARVEAGYRLDVHARLEGEEQPLLVAEVGVAGSDRGARAIHHLGDARRLAAPRGDDRLGRVEDALAGRAAPRLAGESRRRSTAHEGRIGIRIQGLEGGCAQAGTSETSPSAPTRTLGAGGRRRRRPSALAPVRGSKR